MGNPDPRQRLRDTVSGHAVATLGPDWLELANEPAVPSPRQCDLMVLLDELHSPTLTADGLRELAVRSPTGHERALLAMSFRELLRSVDQVEGTGAGWNAAPPNVLIRLSAVALCRLGLLRLMSGTAEN